MPSYGNSRSLPVLAALLKQSCFALIDDLVRRLPAVVPSAFGLPRFTSGGWDSVLSFVAFLFLMVVRWVLSELAVLAGGFLPMPIVMGGEFGFAYVLIVLFGFALSRTKAPLHPQPANW